MALRYTSLVIISGLFKVLGALACIAGLLVMGSIGSRDGIWFLLGGIIVGLMNYAIGDLILLFVHQAQDNHITSEVLVRLYQKKSEVKK